MLGGGVWVTQDKILPGSYINFVNLSSATAAIGSRGTVAIACSVNPANAGKLIEITKSEFLTDCKAKLGVSYDSDAARPLREIFTNATKVYLVDTLSPDLAIQKLDSCEFNIFCAYTTEEEDIQKYIQAVKTWRDEHGKKCQIVVYDTDADYEGVINVVSTIDTEITGGDIHALTAWVAGAEAGCKINESCTNKKYNGEYAILTDKTQTELEECIANGQVAFHQVYGEIRMLEDVNSLTTTTKEKGEDFKSNQTIRIIDQIANDIAKLFNTKYLGKIPNNKSGRVSLWGDIVAHHRELEALEAIENFDSSLLTVEQGKTKKSVVVTDVVTVVNSMAQLYMTVVVQ